MNIEMQLCWEKFVNRIRSSEHILSRQKPVRNFTRQENFNNIDLRRCINLIPRKRWKQQRMLQIQESQNSQHLDSALVSLQRNCYPSHSCFHHWKGDNTLLKIEKVDKLWKKRPLESCSVSDKLPLSYQHGSFAWEYRGNKETFGIRTEAHLAMTVYSIIASLQVKL